MTQDVDSIIRAAIQDIAVGPDRGRDISQEHAEAVTTAILNSQIDEVQTAIFFIAMRMKRESLNEFLGIFAALEKQSQQIIAEVDQVVCLADPFDGYVRNATITPFLPCVLAACGLNTVMHGVETVGPKHGVTAHKVLKLAGMNTNMGVKDAAKKLESTGSCYVDQQQYASALYDLQDLRHRMVKRSALTTLERLLMPIKGRRQTDLVLGYVHKAYPDIYARVALAAGFNKIVLLKGVEGGLAPALNKPLRRFVFDAELPEDVDSAKQVLQTPFLTDAASAAQAMDDAKNEVEQCLEQGLAVLQGAKNIARDSLVLAASHIVMAYEPELSFSGAVEKVQACLDNGAAKARFQALIS